MSGGSIQFHCHQGADIDLPQKNKRKQNKRWQAGTGPLLWIVQVSAKPLYPGNNFTDSLVLLPGGLALVIVIFIQGTCLIPGH